MSRVGKKLISVPQGVVAELSEGFFSATGPKGKICLSLPGGVKISQKDNLISVAVDQGTRSGSAMHGLYRSLIQNIVTGVSVGFEKKLELSGVGYQCSVKSEKLELSVGFSKPVVLQIPSGISCIATDSTHLVVSGVDKQAVGQFSATIRSSRIPDPYKAKGVKYQGEFIRRKAGKAFGSGG